MEIRMDSSKMKYIVKNKKRKARGAAPMLGVMTMMCVSGALMAEYFTYDEMNKCLLWGGVFLASCIWGHCVVARSEAFYGSMPASYLENHVLLKGFISNRKHGSRLRDDRSGQVKWSFGSSYVFFGCKSVEKAMEMDVTSIPDYTLIPKKSKEVPLDELWVDCVNKEVYVNPVTWEHLDVYYIYHHSYSD